MREPKAFFAALAVVLLFTACPDDGGKPGDDEEDGYTVTFDAQGGLPAPPPQTVKAGGTLSEPERPAKTTNETFSGWYTSMASNASPFDFSTPIESSFKLYARWGIDLVTISFISEGGGGAAFEAVKGLVLESRADLNTLLANHQIEFSRSGFIFSGWYTDPGFTDELVFPVTFTGDTPIYLKWSALGDFDGVWSYPNAAYGGPTNLLIADEEAGWIFDHLTEPPFVYFSRIDWDSYRLIPSADGNTLTLERYGRLETLTKTSAAKTPDIGSVLSGYWVNSSVGTMHLKTDGSAEITEPSGDSINLKFAGDADNLYALTEDAPYYVLMTVPLQAGRPAGFAEIIIDDALLGIWEIEAGRKAAYEFTSRTEGAYYALGASFEFSYTLGKDEGTAGGLTLSIVPSGGLSGHTESYGPYSYAISADTLSVYAEEEDGDGGTVTETLAYTRRETVPVYTGGGGDSVLTAVNGRWVFYREGSVPDYEYGYAQFNPDGYYASSRGGNFACYVWQADTSNSANKRLTFYAADIGSNPGSIIHTYTLTGPVDSETLEFNGDRLGRSMFAPLEGRR